MGRAFSLREDFGTAELRRLAARTADAAQARRLLALAAVRDGMNPKDQRYENAYVFGAVCGLARPRSLPGPLIDEAVLLADPHLVLEPDLDRRSRGEFGHDRRNQRWKVFLKAAIASGS